MIPVYGSFATIIICTLFPPLIDRFQKREENWKWSRSIIAYGLMTVTVLVLPILIDVGRYLDLLFIVAGIAVAALIVPVTYAGIFFVIFLSKVMLTIGILWDMARYNVKEPFKFVISEVEWHIFILPVIMGFITLFTLRYLTAKSKRS